VPYQNHQVDKKEQVQQHNAEEERIDMYAARVEMRLAQERRNVLKELLRLAESEDSLSEPSEADVGVKRKRDD
jgi:predicted solute-binding protein